MLGSKYIQLGGKAMNRDNMKKQWLSQGTAGIYTIVPEEETEETEETKLWREIGHEVMKEIDADGIEVVKERYGVTKC